MSDTFVNTETVCASAPGKVILFGEHAVVYGYPAIAAALSDLRIFVWITPFASSPNTGNTIRIVLPDLTKPIDYGLSCADLQGMPLWSVPPTPNETAADIARCVSLAALDDFSVSAVTPILYLFKVILGNDLISQRSWEVLVRSRDLPVGAGLGSSAAFSVALAAALCKFQSSIRTDMSTPSLDTVNQYAYYAEILLHGTPSGLDNAVATYGGALRFHKTVETGQTHLKPLANFTQISMMLVHTHIPRSTKALVAGVLALRTKYPGIIDPILAAMGEIASSFASHSEASVVGTSSAATINGTKDDNTQDNSFLALLLDWVRLNHALLRAVGVSHTSLDQLVQLVDACSGGKAAAKLTGAGGGGCALVVWSNPEARTQVVRALQRQRQYSCFSSTVGGAGVQWHADPQLILDHSSLPTSRRSRNLSWVAPNLWLASSLVVMVAALTVTKIIRRQNG